MTGTHTATLDDVARAAGVSRATASRVVTGQGPASARARDRV
ncbi:LacI family transcriptional regulator, partial [Lentzea sp. PSKA42]